MSDSFEWGHAPANERSYRSNTSATASTRSGVAAAGSPNFRLKSTTFAPQRTVVDPPPPPYDDDEDQDELTGVSLSQLRQDTDLSLTVRSSDFYDTTEHTDEETMETSSSSSDDDDDETTDTDATPPPEEVSDEDDDEHWWDDGENANGETHEANGQDWDQYYEEGEEGMPTTHAASSGSHWQEPSEEHQTQGEDYDPEVAKWAAGEQIGSVIVEDEDEEEHRQFFEVERQSVPGSGSSLKASNTSAAHSPMSRSGRATSTSRNPLNTEQYEGQRNPDMSPSVVVAGSPSSPNRLPPPAANSISSPKQVLSPHHNRNGSSASNGTPLLSPWKQAASMSGSEPSTPAIKFKKGKLLGRGAFGSVYQGMNVLRGELIAIKEVDLPSDVSSSVVKDIQREIQLMAKLPIHDHCVKYLDTHRTTRHIYILMEYVSGGSVASLLNSVGRFHEATIREYAFMTLLGLKHLHDHGILHQDIKGANVLIDEKGKVKIADFGCSRDMNRISQSIKAVGTPLWMAPEVCRAQPATEKSDVWSFGCFLLEMAKDDHLPWNFEKGTPALAVLYAISAATKPPEIPTHLSPLAQDFITQCLQPAPADRPTVEQLMQHPFFSTMTFHDAEGVEMYDSNDEADTTGSNNSSLSTSVSDSGSQSSSSFQGFASDELEETETSPMLIRPGVKGIAPDAPPVFDPDRPTNPLPELPNTSGLRSRNTSTASRAGMRNSHKLSAKHLDPTAMQNDSAGPSAARQQEGASAAMPPPGEAFNAPVVWHTSGKAHVTPEWKRQHEKELSPNKKKKKAKDKSPGLLKKFKCMFGE